MENTILFVTHQLSRTGAPIVLIDMIKVCLNEGYKAEVISLLDGELKSDLEQMGIHVSIKDDFVKDWKNFRNYAEQFHAVVANTLLTYQVIHVLNQANVPVIWWLHEGEQYFEYFKTVIPDFAKLGSNIHVYSVGHRVQDVIMRRYGVMTEILHMGVEDNFAQKEDKDRSIFGQYDSGHEKVRFLIVGTYSKLKAQDILAKAIEELDENVRSQCQFVFCGNEEMYDEEVLEAVTDVCGKYENVHKIPAQPHSKVLELMQDMDYLLVPSRVDPIPTVAVEAMMMEKPCLITQVCGAAYYLKDGDNSFVFQSENVPALAEKISEAVSLCKDNAGWKRMCKNSRCVYEGHFSKRIFETKVKDILELNKKRSWVIKDDNKMISVIIVVCGDEPAEYVHETLRSLAASCISGINLECIVACADNFEVYEHALLDNNCETQFCQNNNGLYVSAVNLGGRDYRTIAQLKNASIPYTHGEYLVYIQPGEIFDNDTLSKLMNSAEVTYTQLLDAGAECLCYSAFSKEMILQYGSFNGKLACGEDFELAVRLADSGVKVLLSDEPVKPVYEEHYNMYAYIFGKYAGKLRNDKMFDRLLMKYMESASAYGIGDGFMKQLEAMIAKRAEYYKLDDAIQPVLIYMGDPICFDVLRSFSFNFAEELRKHGIPVIIYDMSKEGVSGLSEFIGKRFRAVVGFQTALFSVHMKDSEELVNNLIAGPKINFLYDHPLYLYYHFTLKLDNYYVLTQDEDYAEYISRYYPMIKASFHLPPAGIELPGGHVRWEDKIYDIVFVASYHNYRERMLALEKECEPSTRELAQQLLEVMKENPNMTSEEAMTAVLEGRKESVSNDKFARLLSSCMDACRIVMFFYREKVMEVLLDAGLVIHVFGESWRECPLAGRSNMVIHPDVSYMDGIKIMAQSKIALNVMSWHKSGMTERIANTMLNKTVCLTDRTKYLEKNFKDGTDIVMFDLSKLYELPQKVANLLSDDDRMREIAEAGYRNASAKHRWKNRVDSFVDMLDNGKLQ